MSAREDLTRSGISFDAAIDLLAEHRTGTRGYEELREHPEGWTIWSISLVRKDGTMDEERDTSDLLAEVDRLRAENSMLRRRLGLEP